MRLTLGIATILSSLVCNQGIGSPCDLCQAGAADLDCDNVNQPAFRQNLDSVVAQLRGRYGVPSPRGWPTSHGTRIDFTRHFARDVGNEIVVYMLSQGACSGSVRDRIQRMLGDLQRANPAFDPALTLAIAFRESESRIFGGVSKVDTFDAGGLDFLGSELDALRPSIPAGYGSSWRRAACSISPETGTEVCPALVPRNELIVAYGVTINARRGRFFQEAQSRGLDTSVLTKEALRAWTQVFFGAPGGYEYEAKLGNDPPARRLGGITVLTWLNHLIREGKAKNLNDILTLDVFRRYDFVRRALISAGEAELIEGQLFRRRLLDNCLVGTWRVDNSSIERELNSGLPAKNVPSTWRVSGEARITISSDGIATAAYSNYRVANQLQIGGGDIQETEYTSNGRATATLRQMAGDELCSCRTSENVATRIRSSIAGKEIATREITSDRLRGLRLSGLRASEFFESETIIVRYVCRGSSMDIILGPRQRRLTR